MNGVFLVLILAIFLNRADGWGAPSLAEAVDKGRTFLVKLYDPVFGLLPEYRGANIYWLFHDNYLAAKVLTVSNPNIARNIQNAMKREGIVKSGKIELIFGEAEKPFPFREYRLLDVRRAENKTIRTELVTDRVFEGWKQYADLLLLACLVQTNKPEARQHWESAMQFWDGKGFNDAAAKHADRYSTYKLGLAMIVAKRLGPDIKTPDGLLEKLLEMQDSSGGWITDYDAKGQKIGLANVETTCLSILGIEAFAAP